MNRIHSLMAGAGLAAILYACHAGPSPAGETASALQRRADAFSVVKLTTDLDSLSAAQRQMIPLLIGAARIMDSLFWYQAYGQRDSLLAALQDSAARRYVEINYGPWDRLDNDSPFIAGVGPKPAGAHFYPADMSTAEFEQAALPDKKSLYTFLRRDSTGALYTVPYHVLFREPLQRAAAMLRQAAGLAPDSGLARYLRLRAEALLTDEFRASDMAWLDMKDNTLDIVIGPIETYEDALFGYKASYEAYVLKKDRDWSRRLSRYASFLPALQRALPVPAAYKAEKPGADAELNAYDVLYYAGDCNAGGKTIAINLPNDEQVQLEKGTRRLQLKNAMKAKFDRIMVPIAGVLIAPGQRRHVTFDAFFANTMFHEVAHGLGIKRTLDGKGTVREALKEHASALEEGKADILGVFMIRQLLAQGAVEGSLEDYYVTFLAGIFRSVRFGASDAHGVANMIRFNFFREQGAFQRLDDGTYQVDTARMTAAVDSLSRLILTLQGDGDYAGVARLVAEKGVVGPQLRADLDRLRQADIPVDVIFDQGTAALGL